MIFLKPIYIVLGTLSLILGIIGIIVPGLPATPFMLLTAWLYLRGSDKLYHRLLKHKYLGKYIDDFRSGKGMTMWFKLGSLVLMVIMVTVSCLYILDAFWLKSLVVGSALLGAVVMMFVIPTQKTN
ncbi:MAG: YbaN family protein [Bacteroidia bacterium]|nr:YbaN family protein [Bacteroidia bacterium]